MTPYVFVFPCKFFLKSHVTHVTLSFFFCCCSSYLFVSIFHCYIIRPKALHNVAKFNEFAALAHSILYKMYVQCACRSQWHTTIFDKIGWNKIWKSFLCNAVIFLIFMHWNSLSLVSKAKKPFATHDPSHTPVSMLVPPVTEKQNLVLQHSRGAGAVIS